MSTGHEDATVIACSEAVYRRDKQLFAQRMPYTLNGITWWTTPCCYCGDPYEDDDHVLPIAALKKLKASFGVFINADVLRIVPSCHECNLLAGGNIFESFEEKRLYIKAALSRRYHYVMEYPHWNKHELAELQGSMHRWVSDGQSGRDMIFERLRY